MRLKPRHIFMRIYVALFIISALWALSRTARAAGPLESTVAQKSKITKNSEYEIKNGDTLGTIALELGFAMDDLMKTNGIDNPDRIYAGQIIHLPVDPKNGRVTKRGVLLKIPQGFNLTRLGEAYDISPQAIAEANKLKDPDHVREGQEILIPGAKYVVELIPPPPCFKDPVDLYRVHTDVTKTVPLCFCNGRPNPAAVEALSSISGPVNKEVPFPLHPRLVVLLQAITEKFPGKRIEIISGQRLPRQKGNESYHNKGRALDFRVQDVSNRRLVSFARTLDRVGVGYYPNSVFIHLDTRETDAYWIDYSRPGERAIYRRAGLPDDELEKIRAAREEKRLARIAARAKKSVDSLIASLNR